MYWLLPCTLIQGCCYYGSKQRKKHSLAAKVIPGEDVIGAFIYGCCCFSCAMTQEYRSMKKEFLDHRKILAQLPPVSKPPASQHMGGGATGAATGGTVMAAIPVHSTGAATGGVQMNTLNQPVMSPMV